MSIAAVTATRQQQAPPTDPPIPPTDLLVLQSPAKLLLYQGSRHVCDIRVRAPGVPLSPYQGFLKGPKAVPENAESPGTHTLLHAHGDCHLTPGCRWRQTVGAWSNNLVFYHRLHAALEPCAAIHAIWCSLYLGN